MWQTLPHGQTAVCMLPPPLSNCSYCYRSVNYYSLVTSDARNYCEPSLWQSKARWWRCARQRELGPRYQKITRPCLLQTEGTQRSFVWRPSHRDGNKQQAESFMRQWNKLSLSVTMISRSRRNISAPVWQFTRSIDQRKIIDTSTA